MVWFGKWVYVWKLPPISYAIRRNYIQCTCWVCGSRLRTHNADVAQKFLEQHEKNCVEKLEAWFEDAFPDATNHLIPDWLK